MFFAGCLALPVFGLALVVEDYPTQLRQRLKSGAGSACYVSSVSGSGWAPANGTFSGDRNMCVKGKLVPELYVLGAPKCATTSFAFEFSGAGAECAAGTKEYQFWNPKTLHSFADSPADTTHTWLKPLPDCDYSSRRVVADYTPEYLALTARPGAEVHEDAVHQHGSGLPSVLANIYGEHGRRVNFVVMVREPLARMQSWWYYCGKGSGFQTHAHEELAKGMGSAWHSTYGWQLKEWVKVFHLRQFYVIPYKLFNGESSFQICTEISWRSKFRMSCNKAREDKLHGSHPSIDDDVTPEFRASFDEAMAADKSLLVDVLAKGSTKGMGLPTYQGTLGNPSDVEHWLVKSW